MANTYQLTFEQPNNNSLSRQLKELTDFLLFLTNIKKKDELIFDLRKLRFVHPLFILGLASIKNRLVSEGWHISYILPENSSCSEYLRRIYFPSGLEPDQMDNWETILDYYKNRNYLPIINFSTNLSTPMPEIRDRVLSKVSNLVGQNLDLATEYQSAVNYFISEISDNILDHSGVERGWILTQYYPTTEYLDICLADTGKSLLGSFQEHGFKNIERDDQALESALKGISTKSIQRGSGLRSSRSIAMEGLQGEFLLFSGRALYYKNKIINLPVRWDGTLIGIRIRKGIRNFSIYTYV